MFNTLPTGFRHYEVQKLLGSGGFGVVYLARDTKLRRNVVLKTLHAHLAAQPDMVRRFLREARAMARLDHANIVRVNRVEDDPQMPFFEMEYVAGQTLADYRGARVLSLQEAMPLLKQMAAALDVAHQQKIVHRDVKPANVLIKPDGTLKLTDFGIIKLLEATGTVHPSTGGIIGTPSYMAPEQADINRRHEIGPATDIYAFGVVTYELLTGRLPFSGGPAVVILHAHAYTPPPDPRDFNPYLSASVAQVLLNALAKPPTNRYPTATSFVQALERLGRLGASQAILSGTATSPPPIPVTHSFATASGQTTQATPVSPIPSVSPPSGRQTPARTAPATPTSQPAISKSMMVALFVVVLVSILIGGVLRELFPTPSEPGPGIGQATPAQEPELAPPPTATPALGIGSTMTGQDGMRLLYVPEGEFLRGSKENEPDTNDDEKPQRSIYLDAFWIDQTEVSNEMFSRFVEDTGYQTDAQKKGTSLVFTATSTDWQRIDGAQWQHPEGPVSSLEGLEQHPVVQVTWNDAKAYCEWAGRRLPTEAEWEKAARGTDGSRYPWGNEPVAGNRVNYCDNNCPFIWKDSSIDDGYAKTAPVGTYPDGASPYGALQMAGNVWEWVADSYKEDYYKDVSVNRNPQGPATGEYRVLRGSSWYFNGPGFVHIAQRSGIEPVISNTIYGFRCAVSP